MNDVVRLKDQYYILASSSLAVGRTEVLKQGETFAVFDRYGDIHQVLPGPRGFIMKGRGSYPDSNFRSGRSVRCCSAPS